MADLLFSVVIPAYNRAKIITRPLDSIKEQTYRPIEIIIVDDGSTDNTSEIVEKWKSENEEYELSVNYVRKENGGPSSARNEGLRRVHGEYVFFLDSDDSLYHDHIWDAVNVLEQEQSDCVVFGFRFTTTGERFGFYLPPEGLYALEIFLLGHAWGYSSCYMGRMNLLREVGFWNEKIRVSEDYEFLGRVLLSSKKSSVLRLPFLTVWRGQPLSLTKTKNTKAGIQDRLIAEETIINVLVDREDIPDALLTKYASRLYNAAINMYARKEKDFAKRLGFLAARVDRGPWTLLDRVKRFVWRNREVLGWFWVSVKKSLLLRR